MSNKPRDSFVRAMKMLGEISFAAEIGIRAGENAIAMLDSGLKTIILVDSYPEYVEYWIESGFTQITRAMQDEYKAQMKSAIKEYGDRAVYCNEESVKAAQQWRDLTFDYVYIDGNHEHEAAKADIEAWWPKVRPAGILAGHDYDRKGYPGVIKAVDEFAKKAGLEAISCNDSDWMVRKP
jgi:predicted O-methyltransferase YrrM